MHNRLLAEQTQSAAELEQVAVKLSVCNSNRILVRTSWFIGLTCPTSHVELAMATAPARHPTS